MTLRIGSLFSGVGGLEIGLERSIGGHVVWQVERDERCRRVLAKHWPEAIRHDDVRAVGVRNLSPVDIICGGFPCQPFSVAGKRLRQADERHLWPEFARIIRELRPRVVVGENVAGLLAGGADEVLGDLASLGYDAIWDCIPAASVGAPHRRDRLFVVAWRVDVADAEREQSGQRHDADVLGGRSRAPEQTRMGGRRSVADTARRARLGAAQRETGHAALGGEVLADADDARLQGHGRPVGVERADGREEPARRAPAGRAVRGGGHRATEPRVGGAASRLPAGLDGAFARALARVRTVPREWPSRPGEAQAEWEAPRTARGVADRAARLRELGNAVSPVVAEVIGHVVMDLLRGLS